MRFIRAVGEGEIDNRKEIQELVTYIAKEMYIPVKTQSLRKKSEYLTLADALKHGDKFEQNLAKAAHSQVLMS